MDVMQEKGMILNCEKGILTLANHHGFTAMLGRTAKQDAYTMSKD